MKERVNATVSPPVFSLLQDHARYGQSSMSSLIEVAVLAYCEGQASIRNTSDIQAVKEELKTALLSELREEIRTQVFNEVRSFAALQEEVSQPELTEEEKAVVAGWKVGG